jgi:hypothetical protein
MARAPLSAGTSIASVGAAGNGARRESRAGTCRVAAGEADIDPRLTGLFICGCILFPLVLLGLSAGGGLLVRGLGGDWLPDGLILPVGFALLVAICSFTTYIGWLVPAAGWIALAAALAGFALAARAATLRRPRVDGIPWGALAGLAAFAAIAAPTLLTGTPTWTGYTRLIDLGFQMDFSHYLAEAGRAKTTFDSSYHANAEKLVSIGYPGGGQATLGVIAKLIRTDVAWCYQMYHAFAAAMGALAIYSLLGHASGKRAPGGTAAGRPLRAIAAAVAIQPTVLYGYALEGGIKELTTASLLVTVVAVLAERLPGRGPRVSVLPAAVAIAAAVDAFSFGVAPWLGVLLAAAFVLTLLSADRLRTIADWALLTALAIVIALPEIVSALTQLGGIASNAIGGTINLGLGNLSGPVPEWSAAGVWLTGDFRFPLYHVTATHALDVFVIVLAVLGTLVALVRRRWILAFAGVAAPIALWYYVAHSTAWIVFKSFTITGVFALTLAFAGATALSANRRLPVALLGWLAAAVIVGGVLYGNALVYHDTTLAPAARYHDLAEIGKRYAGQGPTLYPSFDEYAEYFLREERGSTDVQPAYDEWGLLPHVESPGVVGFSFSLNQFQMAYLQKFKLIVVPRSPLAVRAPSNWGLVRQTKYFDVWRRERPAADVYVHYPLAGLPHERTATFCGNLERSLRKAGVGASVAYVRAPTTTKVLPPAGAHPDYWKPEGNELVAHGAGSDRMAFTLARGGSYELWMEGTVGRPVKFVLDGRTAGTIAYEDRYPNQYLYIGTRTLAAGRHTLTIERGGGSLHPGSGDDVDPDTRSFGPIVLLPRGSQSYRLEVAPAEAAKQICDAPVGYEWMEVLKPGAAPAGALATTSAASAGTPAAKA